MLVEKQLHLGMYKFYKKDITLPMRLPISIEYDILPNMELEYKVLNTVRFDIGTPERLEKFKHGNILSWCDRKHRKEGRWKKGGDNINVISRFELKLDQRPLL